MKKTIIVVAAIALTAQPMSWAREYLFETGVGFWGHGLKKAQTAFTTSATLLGDIRPGGNGPTLAVVPLTLLVKKSDVSYWGGELNVIQGLNTSFTDLTGGNTTKAEMNYTNTSVYFIYRRLFPARTLPIKRVINYQPFFNGGAGFLFHTSEVIDHYNQTGTGISQRSVKTSTRGLSLKLGGGASFPIRPDLDLFPKLEYILVSPSSEATLPAFSGNGINAEQRALDLGDTSGFVFTVGVSYKFNY